jgi:effector-binding domain-containing protein
MKALKNVSIILLVLVILLIAIAYLLPNKVQVQKTSLIHAPTSTVFEQVNNLHNWEKWSPWFRLDTTMDIKYFGNAKGEGSGYEWKSENRKVGSGSLVIIASVPEDSILTELEFTSNQKIISSILFNSTDSGTMVTWGIEFKLGKNPFLRYIGLFMKKNIENDFAKGLENLDIYLKSQHLPVDMKIELTTIQSFNYISIRDTVIFNDISTKMGEYFGVLMEYMNRKNLVQTHAPFAIYHSFTNDDADIEVGIGITQPVETKQPIISGKFNASNVVVADYYGPYNNISKAHELIQTWLAANNKKMKGPPYEFYVTDPSSEKDSTKWLTRVYYPVE